MIGVATYTDPRPTALLGERERALFEKHSGLVEFLRGEGFGVLDINCELGKYESFEGGGSFGIDSEEESRRGAEIAASKGVSGVVFGLWHWTESSLVTAFVREANVPILLYTDDDPAWAGSTCVTSVGASLWESAVNEYALRHFRIKGDLDGVISWARAVEAVKKLSRSRILLLGAPYTLGMEHLMDDLPRLKRILGDFPMLDQYLLVKKAEEIGEERVEAFYRWLTSKVRAEFDGRMLTPESLRRQIRLYLAAKDLVGEGVVGVSVKCQPELSETYGTTACLIPAFLPFNLDAEGEKPVVPATCEGDVKGTVSSSLLHLLSGKPPLFGDIKYVDDDIVVIANCGAASLYYAELSDDPEENLKAATLRGQCQGKSGAALGYRTPRATFTFARLIRRGGKHYLLYFLGEGVEIDEDLEKRLLWGRQWPHTAVKNPLRDGTAFVEAVGANHLSAVPGDYRRELRFVARIWGFRPVNLNDERDARNFVDSF